MLSNSCSARLPRVASSPVIMIGGVRCSVGLGETVTGRVPKVRPEVFSWLVAASRTPTWITSVDGHRRNLRWPLRGSTPPPHQANHERATASGRRAVSERVPARAPCGPAATSSHFAARIQLTALHVCA